MRQLRLDRAFTGRCWRPGSDPRRPAAGADRPDGGRELPAVRCRARRSRARAGRCGTTRSCSSRLTPSISATRSASASSSARSPSLLAAPLAWQAARTRRHALRVSIFGLLIGLLFMSLVARLYAIQMTWGSTGPLAFFGTLIGVPARSARYAAVQVAIGLLHFVLPVAALMLIGTFQNISPRLEEAAASLGAPRWRVALDVTLPLAIPGLLSAFMIAFRHVHQQFRRPADSRPRRRAVYHQPDVCPLHRRRELPERRRDRHHHVRARRCGGLCDDRASCAGLRLRSHAHDRARRLLARGRGSCRRPRCSACCCGDRPVPAAARSSCRSSCHSTIGEFLGAFPPTTVLAALVSELPGESGLSRRPGRQPEACAAVDR